MYCLKWPWKQRKLHIFRNVIVTISFLFWQALKSLDSCHTCLLKVCKVHERNILKWLWLTVYKLHIFRNVIVTIRFLFEQALKLFNSCHTCLLNVCKVHERNTLEWLWLTVCALLFLWLLLYNTYNAFCLPKESLFMCYLVLVTSYY